MPNDEEIEAQRVADEAQAVADAEAEELAESQRLAAEVAAKRPVETNEAKKTRLEGQLARVNKDLGVVPEVKPKSDGLGYGEKAFLVANGIKGEETKLVEDAMKKTGGTLEEVLDNPYFQAQLKEARDLAGTILATPKGKGGSGVPTDSVEYWMQKPIEEVPQEMRIKVVNAKLAKEKGGLKFYNS